jgi:hypothetical protein
MRQNFLENFVVGQEVGQRWPTDDDPGDVLEQLWRDTQADIERDQIPTPPARVNPATEAARVRYAFD